MKARRVLLVETQLPGGERQLAVEAGDIKPSDLLELLGETIKIVAQHVATEYEAKRVEVFERVPTSVGDRG